MLRALVIALILIPSFAFAATKVNIDTKNSLVRWKGSKAFTNDFHNGTVNFSGGHLLMEKDKVTGGEFIVDMNTIQNDDIKDNAAKAKLVGHLSSADFFDTANHKEAKYVIQKATPGKNGELTFDGTLTVRGKSHPLRLVSQVKKEGKIWIANGKTDFDRTKFDVKYNSQGAFPDLVKTGKDKIINDKVDLEFNVQTAI